MIGVGQNGRRDFVKVSECRELTVAAQAEQLVALLRSMESVAVAYSGGVDSAVVAKAAALALGDRAIAITGASPSVASRELAEAANVANQIGIRWRSLATNEFADPDYVANRGDRCYFCKTELYGQIRQLRPELGFREIVSGANEDDRGDYRPGLVAAGELAVRHPLQELQLSKEDVRALARHWGLPNHAKPAAPCLSSRIAVGLEATPERVARVEQAEQVLRELGFRELRVRYHPGDHARIEVPDHEIARLCEPDLRATFVSHLKSLGFRFVSVDLEGFRSGSLNTLVPIEMLTRNA